MIRKGALVLPEDAAEGRRDVDRRKVEMNNPRPASKSSKRPTSIEGTKEIDGAKYAVIKPELKMEFATRRRRSRRQRRRPQPQAAKPKDGDEDQRTELGRRGAVQHRQRADCIRPR